MSEKTITHVDVWRWLNSNKDKVSIVIDREVYYLGDTILMVQDEGLLIKAKIINKKDKV